MSKEKPTVRSGLLLFIGDAGIERCCEQINDLLDPEGEADGEDIFV